MTLQNVPFRLRLVLMLCVVVAGILMLLGVGDRSLHQQQVTNRQVQQLTELNTELNRLSLQAVLLAQGLRELTSDSQQAHFGELDRIHSELEAVQPTLSDIAQSIGLQEDLSAYLAAYVRYIELNGQVAQSNALLGFSRYEGLRGEVRSISDQFQQPVLMFSMREAVLALRDAEVDVLSDASPAVQQQFENAMVDFEADLRAGALSERFADLVEQYQSAMDDAIAAVVEQSELQGRLMDQLAMLDSQQAELIATVQQEVESAQAIAEDGSTQARWTLWLVGFVVGVLVIAAAGWIIVSVRNTLQQVMRDVKTLGEGDLSARIAINHRRNDDFDTLANGINEMAEKLGSLIVSVVDSAAQSSQALNALNQDLVHLEENNQSVNSQAQSVATSTEEISSTLNGLSHTTDELKSHSSDTFTAAQQGASTLTNALDHLTQTGAVVEQTHNQLKEAGELSSDIDQVIDMINDLASQTNLLALNAAIEAARAGDAGRGFAVVADEVRSLAERTVKATGNITEIVGGVQKSTENALTTMAKAQTHLDGVQQNSQHAGEAMTEIEQKAGVSLASAEQMSDLVEEVTKVAAQISQEMDQVAQRVRSDSESISAISGHAEAITSLVERLDERSRTFTT